MTLNFEQLCASLVEHGFVKYAVPVVSPAQAFYAFRLQEGAICEENHVRPCINASVYHMNLNGHMYKSVNFEVSATIKVDGSNICRGCSMICYSFDIDIPWIKRTMSQMWVSIGSIV